MIKVLHITGVMNRGGAEVMLMDLYRNMPSDVHFDFLVNYRKKGGLPKGDFDDEIKKRGGGISFIPSQWDLGPLGYIREFRRIIQENQIPDIVHIHMNSKSGVIAWAAKKAGVKRVIVHSHANLRFRGSLPSRVFAHTEFFFQKILIRKFADYYWGCSAEANRSLFANITLSPDNSAIINNAVDLASFNEVSIEAVTESRNSYGNAGSLIIGNVGRVVRHKNVLF